jgi:recombination protein RecR
MNPQSIEKLTKLFSKFPTIGERTASRFTYYLLKKDNKEIKELIQALANLKNNVKLCSFCFNPFEEEGKLCSICKDSTRDFSTICIIEKEADLLSIERTNKYKGLYYILGGTISGLKKTDISNLRIKELSERIKAVKKYLEREATIKEVILAFNSTIDGEATSLYLEKALSSLKIKTTRLAKGLPTGGELEYTDNNTLISAIEGRK